MGKCNNLGEKSHFPGNGMIPTEIDVESSLQLGKKVQNQRKNVRVVVSKIGRKTQYATHMSQDSKKSWRRIPC